MMPDDTNLRIAKACGIDFDDYVPTDKVLINVNGNSEWFTPWESESDAVLAAEKFGLFSGMMQCELEFNDGRWFVYLAGGQSTPVGEGTFCEAICQAIISLAAKAD